MNTAQGTFWQDYLNRKSGNVLHFALRLILSPLAFLYGLLMILRRSFYGTGIFRSVSLDHPVISVGNLTTGGTGKTPFEIYLLKLCNQMNIRPLLLSRGYGSGGVSGIIKAGDERIAHLPDELKMIAESNPDIMIAYGANRLEAYNMAMNQGKFDLVILDDGFQHLRIQRDLDILMVDIGKPFGSGFPLPSGNLREPKSCMKYADLIVANHKLGKKEGAPVAVTQWGLPIFEGEYRINEIKFHHDDSNVPAEELRGMKTGVVTAIADPQSFIDLLEKAELKPEAVFTYRDHHRFTADDLQQIRRNSLRLGIHALLVTAKDAVKIPRNCFEKPDIYIIKIEFSPLGDENSLKERIRRFAQND